MNKSIHNLITSGDLSGVTTYQAGVTQATVHRMLQKFCDDVLKPYGITKAQWLIIGTVWDGGPEGTRLTDLAAALDTGLPYLTNAINLLESRRILTRVEHGLDSRSKIVTLDSSFEPKCREIEKGLRDALRTSIYSHIEPADFRVYMKVLYQLSDIG